jgi:heat shock protein HslJ
MKNILIAIIILLTLILGWGIYISVVTHNVNVAQDDGIINEKDATYVINGQKVTLKDGISDNKIVSGSASTVVTRYFGNEVRLDFNGDGREDVAFIMVQNTGGSGTFYYLVAALNTPEGYIGSEGVFLGDRIAPQTTEIVKGNIILVNYADRAPGESFAIQPSVGKSIWLLLDPKTMQFGEVAQNFEGEADPARMKLNMKAWDWINTTYNNDTEVKPKIAGKFALNFKGDKTFSATTDCNGVGGEYSVSGNKISFSKMMSTLMYCDGSQEQDFTKMLTETDNFHFTSKGELILGLKLDSGSFIFR